MVDPINALMGLTMVCMVGFFGCFILNLLDKELDKIN